ncbi:MAG: hypothetical protein ACM3Q2_14185, partial [Syntrophothermus sp.]
MIIFCRKSLICLFFFAASVTLILSGCRKNPGLKKNVTFTVISRQPFQTSDTVYLTGNNETL